MGEEKQPSPFSMKWEDVERRRYKYADDLKAEDGRSFLITDEHESEKRSR